MSFIKDDDNRPFNNYGTGFRNKPRYVDHDAPEEPTNQLAVFNIGDSDERTLHEVFEPCGRINRLYIVHDREVSFNWSYFYRACRATFDEGVGFPSASKFFCSAIECYLLRRITLGFFYCTG